MIRYVLVGAVAIGLAASGGCGDGAAGAADGGLGADGGDVVEPQTDAGADAIACEPGEIVACSGQNSPGVRRCGADGATVVPSSCADGEICRDAACAEVTCVPGAGRCTDKFHAQKCNDDGSAWASVEACEDGHRCEDGYCLDRCGLAAKTNSYISCEYWAVELENHLLDEARDGGAPLPADQRPPFAIVLANTSETYDARVSVFTADDQPAEAIGARTVASDTPLPGTDFVTVHSELVDAEGNRLKGPISGEIDGLKLPRGTLMTLVLPQRSVPFGKSTLAELAYRVESSQPVVAYQFNPLCCNYNYTNDASLLLPTSALTNNYMFTGFPVGRGADAAFSPTLTVLATEPDTHVSVQLSEPRSTGDDQPRPFEELIYPFGGSRVSGPNADGQLSVTMQPFEALNVAGAGLNPVEDLTGSLVEADKPVAVFSGHSCTNIPFNLPACDHLESQLFPLETWGQRFIAAPLKLRQKDASHTREGTYWKFVAREDDTSIDVGINLNPPHVLGPAGEGEHFCREFATDADAGIFELDSGQSCTFGTRQLVVAEGSQPIMIGAFLSGQNSVSDNADWGSHAGDPAFYLVPPEEQYRRGYSFLTPATYFQSYVTVTTQPGVPLTLDGHQLNLSDCDAIERCEYVEYLDRGVARAHIAVDSGPHTITAQAPFGIVVYGYDDYVSYAYTGGLNFKKLTPWE